MLKSSLARIALCSILLTLALAGIEVFRTPAEVPSEGPLPQVAVQTEAPAVPQPAEQVQGEPAMSVRPKKVIRGIVRSGETLSAALVRREVFPEAVQLVVQGLSQVVDFSKCLPGEAFAVEFTDGGELLRCRYERGPLEVYSLEQGSDGTGYRAFRDFVLIERHVAKLSGVVDTSLFASFPRAGADDRLAQAFVGIFSSRIDFNSETQPGDRFDIVFERYYKQGRFLGYGRILAARYQSPLQDFEAYYFRPDEEEATDQYFDAAGQEMGASFLRSPLPAYRVTSGFSSRRLHPILGVYRPHPGVDLAAPVGTPVMAAANGVVEFAGWRNGFGRSVVLSHSGGVKTYYGHLHRLGTGVRSGCRVEQKQVIGYVGASGLATGPHLDYRIEENGVFRNPFTMRFRPNSHLKGEALAAFLREKSQWEDLLKLEPGSYERLIETCRVQKEPDGWLG